MPWLREMGAGAFACPNSLFTRVSRLVEPARPGFGSVGRGVEHGKPGLLNRRDRIIDGDRGAELTLFVIRIGEEGTIGFPALAELVLQPLAVAFHFFAEVDKILTALFGGFLQVGFAAPSAR